MRSNLRVATGLARADKNLKKWIHMCNLEVRLASKIQNILPFEPLSYNNSNISYCWGFSPSIAHYG